MEKHLDFYNKCIETGKLPDYGLGTGLCGAAKMGLICNERLRVFQPTDDDNEELERERLSLGWWGSGLPPHNHNLIEEKEMGFTSLRQTIVAFMSVIDMKDFSKKFGLY